MGKACIDNAWGAPASTSNKEIYAVVRFGESLQASVDAWKHPYALVGLRARCMNQRSLLANASPERRGQELGGQTPRPSTLCNECFGARGDPESARKRQVAQEVQEAPGGCKKPKASFWSFLQLSGAFWSCLELSAAGLAVSRCYLGDYRKLQTCPGNSKSFRIAPEHLIS